MEVNSLGWILVDDKSFEEASSEMDGDYRKVRDAAEEMVEEVVRRARNSAHNLRRILRVRSRSEEELVDGDQVKREKKREVALGVQYSIVM